MVDFMSLNVGSRVIRSNPRSPRRGGMSRLVTGSVDSSRSLHIELLDITCRCLSKVEKGSAGLSTSVSSILFVCSFVDFLGQPQRQRCQAIEFLVRRDQPQPEESSRRVGTLPVGIIACRSVRSALGVLLLPVPSVVLALAKIRKRACEGAACGQTFLPQSFFSRGLACLFGGPHLEDIRSDGSQECPQDCYETGYHASHLTSGSRARGAVMRYHVLGIPLFMPRSC